MEQRNFKFAVFSGNVLKILAAIFMVIDHSGLMLFGDMSIMRIIGRLSFPIFAFMIAEGCKHTKNKVKYFSLVFICGVLFQIVFYVVEKSLEMSIFITFSTSILMIYALQDFKKQLFGKNGWYSILSSFAIFAFSVAFTYLLNQELSINYKFWGCMLPVFAALLHADEKDENQKFLQNIDYVPVNVLTMTIGLVISAFALEGVAETTQFYSLLAVPLLLLYSGKRGKYKMKYFFYLFYPIHLVVIYSIAYLI